MLGTESNPSSSRQTAAWCRLVGGRLLGLFRAALCLFVVVTAVAAGYLRTAQAHVGEAMVGFGDQLVKWQGLTADSAPRKLNVNGLEFGLLTLSTDLDVTAALDPFQELCRRRGGLTISPALAKKLRLGPDFFDTTLRQESAGQGTLTCFDSGHPLTPSELIERLGRLRDTGDLAALGELRYVVAHRTGGRTTLFVLWTEGSVPLLRLFPRVGDAPGRDPKDLPRPPLSQRLLSAAEQGVPYALTLYRTSNQTQAEVKQWYRHELENKGWQFSSDSAGSIVARRLDRSLVITASESATHSTVVTIAELS